MTQFRHALGCLMLCMLAVWRPAGSQTVFFNTSSATLSQNTLQTVATNGIGDTTLLTASGAIARCTALAVDGVNGKLFMVDGTNGVMWSVNLDGTGLTQIKAGLTNYPTDIALDVVNGKIYYTTSSTIQNNNTVQRMDYSGANNVVLFTATGSANGGVSRCTALAVDVLNSMLFIADAGAKKIWSMNLTGGGLSTLAATAAFPTCLALDVTNRQVYFSVSSTVQNANYIQFVKYDGSGLTTCFTASGSIQRCTALDFDPIHQVIYFSDAGANALWRIASSDGSATAVLTGLGATARKIRMFTGATSRPAPWLASFFLSGTNVVFNATNGYAGGTYYVLTSTNLALPLSQWQAVASNVLTSSGNFSLTATNAFAAQTPKRFYILTVH